MGTSLQEKIASLPPERQARIKAETAHLQATYMTLKDLRRAHHQPKHGTGSIFSKFYRNQDNAL